MMLSQPTIIDSLILVHQLSFLWYYIKTVVYTHSKSRFNFRNAYQSVKIPVVKT